MSIEKSNGKTPGDNPADDKAATRRTAEIAADGGETPRPKPADALAENPSPVEVIKDRADYLRGGIVAGLADELTGGLAEDDQSLIKFHGIYQQDDRDSRTARAARKLEPDYSFMIRLRVPGGMLSPAQWLAVDAAAADLTSAGSIRLTTRQTLQFHGVARDNIRPLLQTCARRLLDSVAACGDVNRNVMCSPHAGLSSAHAAAHAVAAQISEMLLPHSRAYCEIWLGEEKVAAGPSFRPPEPLYGKHYLPRKFKIAVAVPPANDVDVYSQDVGFVAVVRDGKLRGFNVLAGGGLGMTFGARETYPRLAEPLGFCAPSQAADVAWHLAALQRDYGDRSDRKKARFKYTIAKLGLEFVRAELCRRLGFVLPPCEATPQWTHRDDVLGWRRRPDGRWDLGVFVENGRIADGAPLKNALREAAALSCCDFLMTPNQNIMLVNIKSRGRVEKVFARRGVSLDFSALSGMRKNAMACVALPTCPLAFAEAERYLPSLVAKLETELARHDLQKDAVSIRMTGCPNGCARPYLGEIGLTGKSPGRYNLYLGAAADGSRLSALAGRNLREADIIAALSPLFAEYAAARENGEGFGDFLVRAGKVRPPAAPADFHD
ncbi:MAG: NADPH-dependent assimilatory sulfite reductase hemoprotein subunit [Gammaproteobacteria bacterium]